MKLIYFLCLLFSQFQLEAKSSWIVFKDTTTPCSFTFEYPKEFELGKEFATTQPEERIAKGIILDIGFVDQMGDTEVHPISIKLAIDIFKSKVNVDPWPGGTVYGIEPQCDFFPWKNTVSTVTLPSGIQATEYLYCYKLLGDSSIGDMEGYFGEFPHEIIVRVIKLPACTVKLTLQIPMLYDKDYSKISDVFPAKDTPDLKKKKLAIRNKLLRSLNSFKLLKQSRYKR